MDQPVTGKDVTKAKRTQKGKRVLKPVGTDERVLARREQVFELRKAGATYRQIGQRLGVSAMQACRDCREAMAAHRASLAESIEDLFILDLARTDAVILSMFPAMQKGDSSAGNTIIRALERRAKMLGHDQPTRTEHAGAPLVVEQSLTLGLTDEELERRMREAIAVIEGHVVDVTPQPQLPEPVDDKAEAYRRELAKRSGKG